VEDSIDLNPFRRRLLKHGESADARVLEIDIPSNQSPGAFLTHRYTVEVQPTSAPAFQAEVKDAFNVFWAPKRGDLLKVKFNRKSHKVAFDLKGDARYDSTMQKQTGQWTPGEASPPSIFGANVRASGTPVFQGIPEPAAGAPGGGSAAERLQQLAQLRDAGIITPQDFEDQKLRILGSI
jgi:hypothetical protein